jgi:octaprenyl-diphosphate synthase
MGDYVLSRGLLLSLDHEDISFLHCTSRAVKRMSEGELLQIQKSRQLRNDEATYFRIIGDKTASLLSTCCEIGALSATTDAAVIAAMREYGEALGIAFQIRDDILDFLGKESTIGKPVGGDLKEKKFTLPLIHALGNAPFIETIIDFVKEFGGIDHAERTAEQYRQRAVDQLSTLPDSPARRALTDLAQFVITRAK